MAEIANVLLCKGVSPEKESYFILCISTARRIKIPCSAGVIFVFWSIICIHRQQHLSVQIPYSQIQIGCKGQPYQIGDLEQSCQLVCFQEGQDHGKYQCPQQKQPKESKTVGACIEEDQTPEEIDNELCDEQIDSRIFRIAVRCQPDPGCADAHKGVQNSPNNGKQDRRRRQRRLSHGFTVVAHSFPAEPTGQPADCFRKKDPKCVRFPCFFHHVSNHPMLGYAKKQKPM